MKFLIEDAKLEKEKIKTCVFLDDYVIDFVINNEIAIFLPNARFNNFEHSIKLEHNALKDLMMENYLRDIYLSKLKGMK